MFLNFTEKSHKDKKSPSDFWREKLGFYDFTNYFFSYRNENEINRHRLNKATRQLARTVNLVKNSEEGEEKSLILKWSHNDVNSPISRDIFLSPDDILKFSQEHDTESVDVLTGQCLMLSAMKATMSQKAYNEHLYDGSEHASDAKTLFRAVESTVAKNEVLKDWAGFRPYFDCYEERTLSTKGEVENYINGQEPSASLATMAMSWNIQHPEDKLILPEIYETAIEAANKEIDPNCHKDNRYTQARKAVEVLYNFFQPPPGCSDSDYDDDEEDDQDDNENDSYGGGYVDEGDEDDDEGSGDESGLSIVDPKNFGEFISNEKCVYALDVDTRNINDDLSSDDYLSYHNPSNGCIELHGIGVAKITARQESIIKYNELVKELKPQIEAVKKVLNFRNAVCKIDEHGAPEGDLDDGSLHKFATGTDTIWTTTTETYKPELAVCLLIDQSGSMCSSSGKSKKNRAEYAKEVAIVMSEALKSIKGVSLTVLGHSGDFDSGNHFLNCILNGRYNDPGNDDEYSYEAVKNGKDFNVEYKQKEIPHLGIYEYISKDHNSPPALMAIKNIWQNLDGYAIEYAARRMAKDYPNTKKVIFHISDGLPEADNYGGDAAVEHTRESCEVARNKFQAPVYGIGIDSAYTDEVGKALYGSGRNVVIGSVTESIPILTSFIKQILGKM